MTMKIKKGSELILRVSDLGEKDRCFARTEEGLGVFVEGLAAVGDLVRTRVLRSRRKHLLARVEEILEPSEARHEPVCAHFGSCGGCKWQHVTYEEQLRMKQKKVTDALAHIGRLEGFELMPMVPAEEQFGYRNKVEFTFGPRRYLLQDELDADTLEKPSDYALGFHAPRQFRKVVDIDTCHIASKPMNLVLEQVKEFSASSALKPYCTETHEGFWRNLVVRTAQANTSVMVNLVTSWHEPEVNRALCEHLLSVPGIHLETFVNNITRRLSGVAVGDSETLVHGPGYIVEKLGSLAFKISANSFFQTNTRQALKLYELTRDFCELTGKETVLDLFCGTGSIGLFLAGSCSRVIGMELVETAVADARANAELNGIDNIEFHQLDLKDLRKRDDLLASVADVDVIVVDPPRAGLHPKTIPVLLNAGAERIVYVSCNPASLARDGAAIVESGAYRLDKVVCVDMFPHTNHIESVGLFRRKD